MMITFEDRLRRAARWSLLTCWLGLIVSSWTPALSAQDAPDKEAPEPGVQGLFITVTNPIDSKAVHRVMTTTNRFLQQRDPARRVKIVYDFNPDGHASCTPDYGPCSDLADFLLELPNVTTIAFLSNEVTGHSVLPVLACKEIVMSEEAKLGDVMREQARPLRPDQRDFYEHVVQGRRRPAVVLKMIDREMEVLKGTRQNSVWYIGRGGLWKTARTREAEEQGFVPDRDNPVAVPGGSTGLYPASRAQELGLCDLIKTTRDQVAMAYDLPPRSFRGDPLEGRTPNVWRIEVKGQINSALQETLERRIRRAIGRQANMIVLQLECGGGDTQVAMDLAKFLRSRTDDSGGDKIMIVAYVTSAARDTATYLALGCTEIVMDREARLGGFERIVNANPSHDALRREALMSLVQEQGYSPLIGKGLLDPQTSIHRVRSKTGRVERQLIEGKDLDVDKWVDEGEIKAPGEWLVISAKLAEELGLAQLVVDGTASDALATIYAHYGVDKEQVHSAGPDWLDDLAAFLGHPLVSLFLVMIGIGGLVLELKMPGVSLPGVVSAICFVLYFWAHSHLAGHLSMLALLLFILGLILIGLEVFVVPGFGVTGISGILLVVISLALATLVKKPETTQEWLDFGTTLSTLAMSLVVAIVGAFIVAWYLPHIPWANRMVLAPPEETPALGEPDGPGQAAAGVAALLGTIGVTATPLRPAGKVRFGEEYVDVVAEGSYVAEGTRVQVVEIEGNRVVVKEV